MRLHPVWGLILFFLAALATTSLAYGAELPGGTPDGYERRDIEGFTVYVNKQVLQQPADRWGRQPITVLERELNDLRRILIPSIFAVLQEVPIWAEWDVNDKINPGAIARYYGGSADGLTKLGGDPRKANCVEVLTLRRLGEIRHPGTSLQQVIILHEMAHAIHHRLLGWGNPELTATFQQAVDRKLYDDVNDRFGRRGKAYARTNEMEYFAEISCAYLDSCNYYPFNYSLLQGYDPAGFAFVERVWKQPERFALIARKNAPVGGATSDSAAAMRFNVYAERAALLKLDRLRAQIRAGQAEQAEKRLEDLVHEYPGTAAATDARSLLTKMN
jgi:hypothetical protein